ncbi:hypothetical protein BHU72_00870 [Desulfuribacillus stibiiarsenatis]|uniref:DUF3298 domain-containing protein n=1 Tax=Desulfuribacillus stibiiarsenatis TaxID=1390249 RepID=A0A1E5L9M8_9FIRM|nr:hypothetical protein [Desulfuribacillus stibiiarsenatis]OEH86850.1 hypothetical protein BHU72_00870 [Desulfuribacillus stibiiarsenatis]
MLRFSKLVVVLISTGMLLTACISPKSTPPNAQPVSQSSVNPASQPNNIVSPVATSYVVDNLIEIETINETTEENHQRSYIQIRGLKNQAIENKINKQIEDLYRQMLVYASGEKVVPYRGAAAIATPDTEVDYSYLSISSDFNSNQVLSVVASLSGAYKNPEVHFANFSMVETLNFNLVTGDTFGLQQVFADDVNELEIANEAILAYLKRRSLTPDFDFDYYANFELIAPFRGIKPDQKFYLTNHGVNLVIDYDNPEFHVGLSHVTVTIPYYEYVAITERFIDREYGTDSIYTQDSSSVQRKRFLNDFQHEVKRENLSYEKNGVQWYVTTGYPPNISNELVEFIHKLKVQKENEVTIESHTESPMYAELNLYAFRMGPYVNISYHLYYAIDDKPLWQEKNYVFTHNGQRIELEDLFVEGYDYRGVMQKHMLQSINNYGMSINIDTVDLEDISFTINDTHVSFATSAYTTYQNEVGMTPIHFSVSYEEFGFEFLKLFSMQ